MSDRDFRKYEYTVNTYTTAGRVELTKNCNGFTITNLGDTGINVDGMILFPSTTPNTIGDSRTIGGNEGEILAKKQLVISFVDPTGTAPKLEVIQKIYVQ